MKSKLNMLCWRGEKYWLGGLLDHPEIMTQGESLEKIEENLKEVYELMVLDDGPQRQLAEVDEFH